MNLVTLTENYNKIKPIVKDLNVTYRTGGTVSNYAKPTGKGYNMNLGQMFWSGGFTSFLLEVYFKQRKFEKNYLDILGDLFSGKDVIYVANIFEPVSNTVEALNKLKSYNCNVVAIELGNEQYYAVRRLNVQQYLERCKPFENYGFDIPLLFQATYFNQNWNKAVKKKGRHYNIHIYQEPKDYQIVIEAHKSAKEFFETDNIWFSEWGIKDGKLKYPIEDSVEYVSKIVDYFEKNNVKHTYHNLVGDTYGVFNFDLSPKQNILNLFKNL